MTKIQTDKTLGGIKLSFLLMRETENGERYFQGATEMGGNVVIASTKIVEKAANYTSEEEAQSVALFLKHEGFVFKVHEDK